MSIRSSQIVLASHNAHKLREYETIFRTVLPGLQVRGYDGREPKEDGATFAENALIKARAALSHTNMPVLADDSGICVDVMGGAPGIFSARWSGEGATATKNIELLLRQMKHLPGSLRSAHFHACLVFLAPQKEPIILEARWEGQIGIEVRGTFGHGYDPIFIPNGYDVSVAELDPSIKDRMSHRAQVSQSMCEVLQQFFKV